MENKLHKMFLDKNVSLDMNFGGKSEFFNLTAHDITNIKRIIYEAQQ